MKLSLNFNLNEFSYSKTALEYEIDNTPNEKIVSNLKLLCNNILQPLRSYFNKPIHITSGYRCIDVNNLVGGSLKSQHILGQASDFYVKGISPFEISKAVFELNLNFDQMILYPNFIHISYVNPKMKENRKQLLYSKDYSGERI